MPVDIQDKVDDHEKRITKIEIDGARLDARIDGLISSTNNLKWGVWGFTFLCLLALIYGALGPKGFNQVVKVQPTPQVQQAK